MHLTVAGDQWGNDLRMPLSEYIEYALYQRDDNPMYLWETQPEKHPKGNILLEDYAPPKFFKQDLIRDMIGEDVSPPLRW
eukprot:CAMPEP_0116872086 /NCGR_PEP_ID=MMETSP0463-20121206/2740_1 /TAXON_ID=181622 /ORGANISM="Strombidinopsis sp, Strain SopsisLIS2011" /LENGTH=79 /DNA_ID=CAMNT_0004511763 /DNA_START=698 /DNA_END=934 /DNA_ORIENTATION=+